MSEELPEKDQLDELLAVVESAICTELPNPSKPYNIDLEIKERFLQIEISTTTPPKKSMTYEKSRRKLEQYIAEKYDQVTRETLEEEVNQSIQAAGNQLTDSDSKDTSTSNSGKGNIKENVLNN